MTSSLVMSVLTKILITTNKKPKGIPQGKYWTKAEITSKRCEHHQHTVLNPLKCPPLSVASCACSPIVFLCPWPARGPLAL